MINDLTKGLDMYGFELKGQVFGSLVFRNLEDAQQYLSTLVSRSAERYERAIKAKHTRTIKALRQIMQSYQTDLRIVPVKVDPSMLKRADVSMPVSKNEVRHSSVYRSYLDVA